MGVSERGILSIASVLVLTLLRCAHEAACETLQGGDLCWNRALQGDCVAPVAGEEGHVWCDLQQRSVAKFGGASCFASTSSLRRQSRRLLDDNECGSMATKDLCSRVDYCKWCRSEVLDDTCFGAAEAARLPRSIFLCSDVS